MSWKGQQFSSTACPQTCQDSGLKNVAVVLGSWLGASSGQESTASAGVLRLEKAGGKSDFLILDLGQQGLQHLYRMLETA